MYVPTVITRLPPLYRASSAQSMYVAALADLYGETRLDKIAGLCGVEPIQITVWHEDPAFRAWLTWELEERFERLLPLLWKEVFLMAVSQGDAKVKLEAIKLAMDRFDKTGILKVQAQAAAQRFVKSAGTPRLSTITVGLSAKNAAP